MRLFAAIPVSGPARDSLVHRLSEWRATDWPVRWVHDDGLHLTLKFFGEVAPTQLPSVEAALRSAVAGVPALPIAITELGAFPTRGRARVVWVGAEGPPALELLQDGIERKTEALGFPLEGRPFRPHITVGRVRDGARLPSQALEALENDPSEPVSFLADRLVLYESLLSPRGPRYEPRVIFDLG